MTMAEKEVIVLCYWNGSIKYGSEGVYFEGSSTPKKLRIKRKTELNKLLAGLYLIMGLEKTKSKFKIFGKYPSVVSQSIVKYLLLPVVDDCSLETMLEVPSKNPSIKNVELYLEVNEIYDACSLQLEIRDRTEKEKAVTNPCPDSGVSKPCLVSSLWVEDDNELRVGLCFKDRDELKKAVDWFSIRKRRKCVVRETEKDTYTFECVRWKCNWSLCAARKEEHGVVEITKYTGPHTCFLKDPEDVNTEFIADEIERVIRVQPTLSIEELKKLWKEKIGYEVETSTMKETKLEVIKRVFGDEDESFRVIPKLMSAFHSSNGLLVDWKYDVFPNPEFASFRGVFWAFPQSIEGFQHCRPLIAMDSKNLNGKYPLRLMIASGVDAANKFFPLAFAVTKEVSVDSWRWFLTGIREKVTQRKGLCLISSPHPDILAVINEPKSRWKEPWAYHRFCLNHLCIQFNDFFQDIYLACLVEKAGYSRKKEEFDSYMNEIKEKNPEARRRLDQIPLHQWALAHDDGLRYGIMEIDTEALFAVCRGFSYYNVAITCGVVLMFDELRDASDESFSCSRDSLNRGDVYTKPVMDKLEEFMTSSVIYAITPLEKGSFQVTDSCSSESIVHLNDSTCSCGNCKFPCLHALAVCDKLKINPLQYVDDCYTLERYHKTYAAKFNLVPEVSSWPEASGVPTLFPPVSAPPLSLNAKH